MYSLSEINKQFSQQKINKTKKLPIREVEEEKKNHFVCFVDDEDESFDVQIVIGPKSVIIESSCDCGSADFCTHQLALALHLSENSSSTSSKKGRAKKVSEAEIAMESLNSEEMKFWLLEFFKKNKDAEMQFLIAFGEKKKDFSEEEIKELISKAIQSVIGRKKNVTAPEVKKIVELLEKLMEPVQEFLLVNISKKISLDYFNLINDELFGWQNKIFTSSNRIEKFLERLKQNFAHHFNKIKDEEIWNKNVKIYWNLFLKGEGIVFFYFYNLLLEIYYSGNEKQKHYIANLVKNQIDVWIENSVGLRIEMREDLLDIIIENNLFNETKLFFPIQHYQNSYNVKILNELLKTDKKTVEDICKTIIARNSNDRYDFPYYEILEKIAIEENDPQKIAYLKRKKFDANPNVEDYIFIEQNEVDRGEFKKFRTRFLSKNRSAFYFNPLSVKIYFEILEYEKNYKKMIEIIDERVPSSILNRFADKLFLTNKDNFLSKLNYRRISLNEREEDEKLADFLISNYDKKHLQQFFGKSNFGFGVSTFSKMILEKLK